MDPILQQKRLTEATFWDDLPLSALRMTEGTFWPPDQSEMLVIFRGEQSPENIDYATPIAWRVGTGDVVLDSPPHAVLTNYYYAARQVSVFGRMEQNYSRLLRFRRLADGSMEGSLPDHVTNLKATAKIGGKVLLSWTHTKLTGAKPSLFNVYYDQGEGGPQFIDVADVDCKLGTESYRGSGGYSYLTDALEDGPYWFAVQAETADGDEDRFNLTVLAVADGTGPDPIATVTVTTRL